VIVIVLFTFCLLTTTTAVLTNVLEVNLSKPVHSAVVSVSLSSCSGMEPLGINGLGFCGLDALPPHTWNSLPSDIRSCHTLHTFRNTSKHTCSDSLNLKPPAPPYPLQDFKALYKCCIIIIIILPPSQQCESIK